MWYRGLGEVICVKFAQEGANVVVNYNASEERAKGVKARIEGLEECRGVKVFVVKGVSFFAPSCFLLVMFM